ncbi:hypothetical protein [Brachybacterium paraconglomeratum]|uniref:hypothetical protein n=1 Tax=Brachybacterium paraconglomeratum TaxID=173362 RepID=UPI00026C68FB|nr:hypothetical protein [Brachybacterium paraconglomeratum]
MTTDPFTTAAHALGADPAEVRESMRNATEHAERNGMPDEDLVLWIWHAGAVWARGMEAARAAQEPTEEEVTEAALAMCRGDGAGTCWNYDDTVHGGCTDHTDDARAALSAARAARRDEEER